MSADEASYLGCEDDGGLGTISISLGKGFGYVERLQTSCEVKEILGYKLKISCTVCLNF